MSRFKIDRTAMMMPALLIAVLVCSLMPGMALAQATPPASMTPSGLYETFIEGSGDNFTMLLLQQIFGSSIFAVAGDSSATSTLFGDIVGYFNAAVLVVGGVMFLNNLATGTLQSAHEGEVMGRNWSSLWAPLRSIMAIALLIPLPNYGGYNTAQVFTAFIVKNATTFATSVWSISAEKITTGVMPVTAPIATLPKEVVSEMFLIQLCSVILNDQFQMGGTTDTPDRIERRDVAALHPVTVSIEELQKHSSPLNVSRFSYDRVDHEGNVKEAQICGYYQTPAIPDVINHRISDPADSSFDLGTALGTAGSTTVRSQFETLHKDVMNNLATRMNAVATTAYNAHKAKAPAPDISAALEQALITSRNRLETGYAQIMNTIGTSSDRNNEIRQMMIDRISNNCEPGKACSGEGWIGAGSWYMLIARLNNEISTLFTAESEVKSYRTAGKNANNDRWWWQDNSKENALRDQYVSAYDNGVAVFNNAANRMAAQGWPIDFAVATNIADSLTGDDIDAEKSNGLVNKIRNLMTHAVTAFATPGNQDPMIGIVNFGQTLVPAGVIIVGADFFLPGNVASTVGAAIATAGVTMAVVLPLMPFVFWVMAVTGYFLLVVEAFIAVNLWALGMLKMDGEGIFGPHSREGWLMILALMFTPILMVAGFFVGMIIFRITSIIISMGLTVSMAGVFANANVFFVIFSTAVIAIFMLMIYFVVLERSFSLVSEFPMRVLRWMGAQVNLDTSGSDRVRAAALGTVGTSATALGSVARDRNYGPAVMARVNNILGRNSASEKKGGTPPSLPPSTSGS